MPASAAITAREPAWSHRRRAYLAVPGQVSDRGFGEEPVQPFGVGDDHGRISGRPGIGKTIVSVVAQARRPRAVAWASRRGRWRCRLAAACSAGG